MALTVLRDELIGKKSQLSFSRTGTAKAAFQEKEIGFAKVHCIHNLVRNDVSFFLFDFMLDIPTNLKFIICHCMGTLLLNKNINSWHRS